MRFLVVLVLLLSARAYAIPHFPASRFDSVEKAEAKRIRADFFQAIEEARAEYLASGLIGVDDLNAAQKLFFDLCQVSSESTTNPYLSLKTVSFKVLPFWRDMMRAAGPAQLRIGCKMPVLYRMMPSPWAEEDWAPFIQRLAKINAENKPVYEQNALPMFRAVAARANPSLNPLPEVLTAGLHTYIDKMLETVGLELSAEDLLTAPIEEVHGLLKNSRKFSMVADQKRSIGFALEALKPGYLTLENPRVAEDIFTTYDLDQFRLVEESLPCELALHSRR